MAIASNTTGLVALPAAMRLFRDGSINTSKAS